MRPPLVAAFSSWHYSVWLSPPPVASCSLGPSTKVARQVRFVVAKVAVLDRSTVRRSRCLVDNLGAMRFHFRERVGSRETKTSTIPLSRCSNDRFSTKLAMTTPSHLNVTAALSKRLRSMLSIAVGSASARRLRCSQVASYCSRLRRSSSSVTKYLRSKRLTGSKLSLETHDIN